MSLLIRYGRSFRPGEITAEEANKVGYELAMRFTKGKHAFVVATHTDRQHIHNHVIFNSTALDGTRKFRDFFFSALAVQRLSDLICLEHQLSVIEIKPTGNGRNVPSIHPKKAIVIGCVASSTASLQKSPRITKIFCKNWNSKVMRSSVENTPPSRAHGKNGSYASKHWGLGTARMNCKR